MKLPVLLCLALVGELQHVVQGGVAQGVAAEVAPAGGRAEHDGGSI